jgi:urea carboxylase
MLDQAVAYAGQRQQFGRVIASFQAVKHLCAEMAATLDGASVPWWTPVAVNAGSVLKIGAVTGAGVRAYLAIGGGLDEPLYMGSRATFTLGKFGGHGGRALRVADVLRVAEETEGAASPALAQSLQPALSNEWTLRVIYGPHGAPDFYTPADIERRYRAALAEIRLWLL